MSSLKVIFAGVTTHFRNGIVAGVRHRVVLPDASRFLVDSITVEECPDNPSGCPDNPYWYYINPHFAQLEVVPPHGEPRVCLDVPQLLRNGFVQSGIRLQVGNGIPPAQSETVGGDDTAGVDDLRVYDPTYEYSADVVLGGRAACYFDFDYGTFEVIDPKDENKPKAFSITVETSGAPWLAVTPLNQSVGAPTFTPLSLGSSEDVTLFVKNTEAEEEEVVNQRQGDFDFLLHFLTSRGGIPKRITQPTPGMGDPASVSKADIGKAMECLGELLKGQVDLGPAFFDTFRTRRWGQTPACSPAQFG